MYRTMITVLFILSIMPSLYSKEVLVDRIVAVVNDDVITQSDLKDFERTFRNKKIKIDPKEFEKVLSSEKNTLDKMVMDKIIYQYLKESSLLSSKDEIDELIRRRAASINLSEKGLEEQLRMAGQTIDDFREEMQIEQGKAKIFERELKTKITVSESECRALFKTEFKQDVDVVEYKISDIIAKTDETANEIEKKLKSGASFSDLFQSYDGTDMGFIKSGDLTSELFSVIQNMNVGDVKGPIRTKAGSHIIKLEEIRSGTNGEYLKNKDQIERVIIDRQFQRQLSLWIDERKEESYVRVYI